jgi:hypothetical protein
MFNTAFTKALFCPCPEPDTVHVIQSCFFKANFNIIFPCGVEFSGGFREEIGI